MNKQKLERLAKKLKCQIEFAPAWDILAPNGKCFASDPQCHTIVFEPDSGGRLSDVYQDAYNRLSCGLLDCNCEQCQDAQQAKAHELVSRYPSTSTWEVKK